jgi:hypothetical protein
MPSSTSYFPRLAALAVGSLFLVAACVDLTKPWERRVNDGAAGAEGGGTAGGTSGFTGGNGGSVPSGAGGAGGASSDAGPDLPVGGTGGVISGGIDGGRGGASGGSPGVEAGLEGGGGSPKTDGPSTGGTGDTDTPLGGTGGTTLRDAETDLRRDLGPDVGHDLGPDSGPDAPPDVAVDIVDAIPLPTGLVAYYPCESANGVVLPDRSGNGYDATLSIGLPPDGGTAPSGTSYRFEAGKVGNALILLQAGYGYVSMPPSIFNGATAVTVAFWIKVNRAQDNQRAFDVGINLHLDKNPPTGGKYFNLVPQTGSQLELAITTNGYNNEQRIHANAIVPADGWRHVAVTLDGSRGVVYVNGLGIAGTTTTSNTVTLRPSDLGTIDYAYLGKSPWGVDPYFDGQIDEVRVYRRALSATEVLTLAQFTGP